MNGYVYYFTVVIFVMINYHICSGDIISEKNYRGIQRRRLVRKLHNRNKKKFKAGWQHSLEQAHIITDLNSVDVISVNEIGGDEICEISQINIDRIYKEQGTTDTNFALQGGCCCNPNEFSNACIGTGDDVNPYYGSTTWQDQGTYTIDGKTRGISCESAKINYNTNNYYEIEIYIRANQKSENTGGPLKDTVSAVVGADSSNQINYLIITKKLKKYVTIAGPTSSYEIVDYTEADGDANPNTSPYAGCCVVASSPNYPYVDVGDTHDEEIRVALKGATLEAAYYELSDLSSKLNIKTGDRIFLKSGYGIATDDEWHDDDGDASAKANDAGYNTNGAWGTTPVRSSIGIPFSVGYYTTENVNDETVQTWNPLKGQDWNGNFVSLAEVGCRSWWNFVTISPGTGQHLRRVDLSKQYREICQPNEKQWMAMPSELDNLKIRVKIPTGSELKEFHRTIFGYSGDTSTYPGTDGFQGSGADFSLSASDWASNFLVQKNLFLLHHLGIVQLNSAADEPYPLTTLVQLDNPELPDAVYDDTYNSKFPTQTWFDFVSVDIVEDEYKPFDVFLNYPTVGGESVRNYFLIDVEMLGWRDSEDQPVSCIGDPSTSATNCISNGKSLKVISSEMIETACDPDFYKDYSNNRGRCKKCITSCTYGQYVDTSVCTGYGRDTSNVCKDVVQTRFCPSISGNAAQYTTVKQVPDCNGVCDGEETNCPWMYGYAQLRNPWEFKGLIQTAPANPVNNCGYYCGKWRGISRMDNGFPEFVFVPIHPDEPICKLLKGHDLVSQCKIVNNDGATTQRDFTCTGTGNSDGSTQLDFTGIIFNGEEVEEFGSASYSQVNALINNLPKSESCGGTAVMNNLGYDDLRSTDGKSRTFKRGSFPP